MWTWTLAAALAAAPTVDSVDHAPPYMMSVNKRGHLVVLDSMNEELEPQEALTVAGLHEAAEAYSKERRRRKGGAMVLWIGGGALSFAGTADLLLDGQPAMLIGGLAVHVAGYPLLYSSPDEHLEGWVDERTLARRLDARTPHEDIDKAADEDDRQGTTRTISPWVLNERGLVETSDGRKVGVVDLARAVGDERAEDQYVAWRRTQRQTWGGMMIGGGVVTVAGLAVAGLEINEETTNASLATSAVGAAMTAGGFVGLEMANRPAHARRWLSPEQIEQAIQRHNSGEISEAPDAGTARWSLQPIVGPGYLGLSGTF